MKFSENVTDEELKSNHCFETSDSVPNEPEVTRFKRLARYKQYCWLSGKGYDIGCQPYRKKAGKPQRKIGSRIDLAKAEKELCNFLSTEAKMATIDRLSYREPGQTLHAGRLLCDALSSMPMCFNLFGPLKYDQEYAQQFANSVIRTKSCVIVDVKFEWSPGRSIRGKFLENKTAFDVAIFVKDNQGDFGVIGIETKYQEHLAEPKEQVRDSQKKRYVHVARNAGIYGESTVQILLNTELRQIMQDHLLALSITQDHEAGIDWTKHLLLYPRRNKSISDGAKRYQDYLKNKGSFVHASIEDTFGGLTKGKAYYEPFKERYLW